MSNNTIIAVNGLGVASPTLSIGPFDPQDLLMVLVQITSLSTSGVPQIQFNGDTGTDYSYSVSDNFGTPVTGTSATGISWGAINSTNEFCASFIVGNGPSAPHSIFWQGSAGALVSTTAPHILNGAGVWTVTNQITNIQISSPQGGNLGAGSGIMVVAFLP